MTFRAKLFCAVAVTGFAAFAATAPANALTTQECSAKYQAAKKDGTLGGMKWNDFRKAQCGADATPAAAAPATPAAAPPAAPAGPRPPPRRGAPGDPPAGGPGCSGRPQTGEEGSRSRRCAGADNAGG